VIILSGLRAVLRFTILGFFAVAALLKHANLLKLTELQGHECTLGLNKQKQARAGTSQCAF